MNTELGDQLEPLERRHLLHKEAQLPWPLSLRVDTHMEVHGQFQMLDHWRAAFGHDRWQLVKWLGQPTEEAVEPPRRNDSLIMESSTREEQPDALEARYASLEMWRNDPTLNPLTGRHSYLEVLATNEDEGVNVLVDLWWKTKESKIVAAGSNIDYLGTTVDAKVFFIAIVDRCLRGDYRGLRTVWQSSSLVVIVGGAAKDEKSPVG
jgi:hypothetical protein